jgi:hypothetical protein
MSHDTHGHSKENQSIISFKNSFWLVVIIVGLFVAALNFVKAESGSEEDEGTKENTEMKATTPEQKEATPAAAETKPAAAPAATDTAKAAK